jgi:hypothetical protein
MNRSAGVRQFMGTRGRFRSGSPVFTGFSGG